MIKSNDNYNDDYENIIMIMVIIATTAIVKLIINDKHILMMNE